MEYRDVTFSGIQPSGNMHIGNYLGAVKNWVSAQQESENIYCIVNSHAITVKQDPKELHNKTFEMAALLIACGIDPNKSILFIQSQVKEHYELAWILNCNIPMGDMKRMTQFKDKSKKNPDNINVGLFDYPALMAADILLYQAKHVPVGNDQKQHIELARDVAERFNRDYGKTFTIPEPVIPKLGARVMGLDDATKKMSKSDDKVNHAIYMLDTADTILSKFKKAKTDSLGTVEFDKNRPEMYNLLGIYQSFTGKKPKEIEKEFEGKGYGYLKTTIAEAVIESLKPIQAEYDRLMKDKKNIQRIMNNGAEKARDAAQKTINLAKERVGLV